MNYAAPEPYSVCWTSTTSFSSLCVPRRRGRACFCRTPPPLSTIDIAAEALEKLDADIDYEELDPDAPFEEGDLGVLSDVGLPEGVLGVIISDTDLYADEQLGMIAARMGFPEEFSAVLELLNR